MRHRENYNKNQQNVSHLIHKYYQAVVNTLGIKLIKKFNINYIILNS